MARAMQDCVILLGDSITSRQEVPGSLQALMGSHYRRTLDIINRGYGGYTTRYILTLLDQIFARKGDAKHCPTIRLVTIWLGTNDASLHSPQHVPLSEYTENLRKILEALTSPNSPYAVAETKGLNIVLITPPTLCPDRLGTPVSRTLETTKKYVDEVVKVGQEWKAKEGGNWRIATINLWEAMYRKAKNDEAINAFFNDGLHLTTEGYAVVWEEYTKIIKTEFKGRGLDWDDLEDLPMRVPDWGDVDYDHPESVVSRMKLPPIRQ